MRSSHLRLLIATLWVPALVFIDVRGGTDGTPDPDEPGDPPAPIISCRGTQGPDMGPAHDGSHTSRGAYADGDEEAGSWQTMRRALDTLWHGTVDERLAVALNAEGLFFNVDEPPDDGGRSFDEILNGLRSALAAEHDEWIRDRLSAGLAELQYEELNPLFRETLAHRSPNVRWRAVRHYRGSEDAHAVALLEKLWRQERRPWVRIDLMEALSYNDAPGYAESCLRLMDDDDTELALAAIEAVGLEAPPGALAALIRRARRGASARRAAAVAELAGWQESRQAQDAVLEASRAADPDVRLAGIRALGSFALIESRRRILEIAASPSHHALERRVALRAIRPDQDAGAIPILWAIRDEIRSPDGWQVGSAAQRILHRLGLLRSSQLVNAPPARSADRAGSVRSQTFPYRVMPPGAMAVRAAEGFSSVRCWEGPQRAGDPEIHHRIPNDMRVPIEDHFEDGEQHWVKLASNDCWVRLHDLIEADDFEAPPAKDDDGTAAFELDVAVEDLDEPLIVSLREAGFLRSFDPHDRVEGVRIEIEPSRREQVEELLEEHAGDDGPLRQILRALLREPAGDREGLASAR